ncbi:transcription factor E2F5 isoform X2 [Hypomesus transpacificus]|uniref:transcription factor E2F5 isoform X2 n=1 Tax=Hypomesus transpacificus TaxID=137520 RepID=UPI001F087DE8|nr:transcription factor E2F5 isoform X2 [Hypomesus transpacificus]
MAESVRSSQSNGGSSRHEKSLGLLTIKFVTLLQEAKDGVLDLKVAADSLAVRQKRRIYDITNVLEGVGLIEKKTKNIIQWRGENLGCQTQEVLDQVETLKAQISELERKEMELDSQKAWLEQNITHMNEDSVVSRYKYISHEDVCDAFVGDTLLAVVAPSGTQLEVPMPETGQKGQKKYQVNLRSQSAPIKVMLINREHESSKPVVFSVPPLEDLSSMPTPPTTPASLQTFPMLSAQGQPHTPSSSPSGMHDLGHAVSHKMAPLGRSDDLTPSSSPPDMQMECHAQTEPVLSMQPVLGSALDPQQQVNVSGQELQSLLDVGSLLKLHPGTGDQMKDEREGVADLIDELMSSDVFPLLRLSPSTAGDYNFNLDDNEGVCDLFDVQILNY